MNTNRHDLSYARHLDKQILHPSGTLLHGSVAKDLPGLTDRPVCK